MGGCSLNSCDGLKGSSRIDKNSTTQIRSLLPRPKTLCNTHRRDVLLPSPPQVKVPSYRALSSPCSYLIFDPSPSSQPLASLDMPPPPDPAAAAAAVATGSPAIPLPKPLHKQSTSWTVTTPSMTSTLVPTLLLL